MEAGKPSNRMPPKKMYGRNAVNPLQKAIDLRTQALINSNPGLADLAKQNLKGK